MEKLFIELSKDMAHISLFVKCSGDLYRFSSEICQENSERDSVMHDKCIFI